MINKIKGAVGNKPKLHKVGFYVQCTQEVMDFVTKYDMQWLLSMVDAAFPVRVKPWRRFDSDGVFQPVTIEVRRPQAEGKLMGNVYIHNLPPKNSPHHETHKERGIFLCEGLFFDLPTEHIVFRLDDNVISIADDNFYHEE